jgi:hypothetical protein
MQNHGAITTQAKLDGTTLAREGWLRRIKHQIDVQRVRADACHLKISNLQNKIL